jgi:hypothetical protein
VRPTCQTRQAPAAVPTNARDVVGEEVHAVPVQVAARAVAVLGDRGVGVPGEDLGVSGGDPFEFLATSVRSEADAQVNGGQST